MEALFIPLSILGVFLGNYFERKKKGKAVRDIERQAFEAGYRDGCIGLDTNAPPLSVDTGIFMAYLDGYYKGKEAKSYTKE